jgi:glycosyltransferase involved in cell wall biosynthesis
MATDFYPTDLPCLIVHLGKGGSELTPNLTIALPLHNAERIINRTVQEILDVAQAATGPFTVILIDNGSTDDTYEAAYQLSRCYPQIAVLWQPIHSGLGAVIELIRTRVTTDRILVHDGVSPICATQLGHMLTRASGPEIKGPPSPAGTAYGLRRFAPISALTENMRLDYQAVAIPGSYSSDTFGDLTGFQWVPQARPLPIGRRVHTSCFEPLPALPRATLPDSMARTTS